VGEVPPGQEWEREGHDCCLLPTPHRSCFWRENLAGRGSGCWGHDRVGWGGRGKGGRLGEGGLRKKGDCPSSEPLKVKDCDSWRQLSIGWGLCHGDPVCVYRTMCLPAC
jgi:hypothetical protein